MVAEIAVEIAEVSIARNAHGSGREGVWSRAEGLRDRVVRWFLTRGNSTTVDASWHRPYGSTTKPRGVSDAFGERIGTAYYTPWHFRA